MTHHLQPKTVISIEDFDPLGPKDKLINSPRSLRACRELNIQPEELFIWDEEEFIKVLKTEGIEGTDTKAAYQEYLEQMDQILKNLKILRSRYQVRGSSDRVKNKDSRTKTGMMWFTRSR
jgi:hypothetical protein